MTAFDELDSYDALGLADLIWKGEVSPGEVCEASILRIEELNPAVNAVVTPMFGLARERIQDGLPGVVLEAMAAGLPVVAFDLPMMPELVENGVTGELVPVGDVTAMACRAAALVADRDRLNVMGERARQRVQRFSLDRCVRQTVDLYRELSFPARGG